MMSVECQLYRRLRFSAFDRPPEPGQGCPVGRTSVGCDKIMLTDVLSMACSVPIRGADLRPTVPPQCSHPDYKGLRWQQQRAGAMKLTLGSVVNT